MTAQHVDAATDADLVGRFRAGDGGAFAELLSRHERRVYNLAYRMLGRSDDAQDATQDAFLSCYRNLSRFRGDSAFGTWLHRIAVNCSIDLIRGRPHREASHDAVDLEQFGAAEAADAGRPSPERLMLSSEVEARITGAMAGLSQMERAAFVLRHFEGQSIDEISRALGLKPNAAKHSIFRAVRKMRIALEPFVS